MPIVREATLKDVFELAPILREADKAEVYAATGEPPEVTLQRSFSISRQVWAVEDEGQCHMLFGVAPFPLTGYEYAGVPWMLASDRIHAFKTPFLKQSRLYVQKMHDLYPLLINYADNRNEVALRWLHWCGFEFTKVIPDFGFEQRPFIEFVSYRQHV